MSNNNKTSLCCTPLSQGINSITKMAGNSGATEHEHQLTRIQRLVVQENQRHDKFSLLNFVFFVLYSFALSLVTNSSSDIDCTV